MAVHTEILTFATAGRGLMAITPRVEGVVARSGISRGLVVAFCRHTSCSLMIMENADPTARRDLEAWLDRLVPSADPHFRHTLEGPDDMPAHIKMALTRTSESIPLEKGRMLLGTWQGIFLWEHRDSPHRREVVVTVMGEAG